MGIHNISYLLQEIYITQDVLVFDEIYYEKFNYLKEYIKKNYQYVNDKSLYSISDIIQETWLNIWLFMTKDYISIKTDREFNDFLIGVVNDTIIELNK